MTMDISIGIMAHNEEKNIGKLLHRLLEEKSTSIREIIVVDDASTDNTATIVKGIITSKVRLIQFQKRSGKAQAINTFLKSAAGDIVVVESADTIPEKGAIENLLRPFEDPHVGMAGARAIPVNLGQTFADFFGRFIYELHHEVSLKQPKFGELIAFRNVIEGIPDTYVDEEYIAMMMEGKGYNLAYCPESVFYNKQPEIIREIISRRTRNCIGHLDLKRKGYYASTSSIANIFPALLRCLNAKDIHLIFLAILLESYIRILAGIRFFCEKSDYAWKMATTTKEFSVPLYLSGSIGSKADSSPSRGTAR